MVLMQFYPGSKPAAFPIQPVFEPSRIVLGDVMGSKALDLHWHHLNATEFSG